MWRNCNPHHSRVTQIMLKDNILGKISENNGNIKLKRHEDGGWTLKNFEGYHYKIECISKDTCTIIRISFKENDVGGSITLDCEVNHLDYNFLFEGSAETSYKFNINDVEYRWRY